MPTDLARTPPSDTFGRLSLTPPAAQPVGNPSLLSGRAKQQQQAQSATVTYANSSKRVYRPPSGPGDTAQEVSSSSPRQAPQLSASLWLTSPSPTQQQPQQQPLPPSDGRSQQQQKPRQYEKPWPQQSERKDTAGSAQSNKPQQQQRKQQQQQHQRVSAVNAQQAAASIAQRPMQHQQHWEPQQLEPADISSKQLEQQQQSKRDYAKPWAQHHPGTSKEQQPASNAYQDLLRRQQQQILQQRKRPMAAQQAQSLKQSPAEEVAQDQWQQSGPEAMSQQQQLQQPSGPTAAKLQQTGAVAAMEATVAASSHLPPAAVMADQVTASRGRRMAAATAIASAVTGVANIGTTSTSDVVMLDMAGSSNETEDFAHSAAAVTSEAELGTTVSADFSDTTTPIALSGASTLSGLDINLGVLEFPFNTPQPHPSFAGGIPPADASRMDGSSNRGRGSSGTGGQAAAATAAVPSLSGALTTNSNAAAEGGREDSSRSSSNDRSPWNWLGALKHNTSKLLNINVPKAAASLPAAETLQGATASLQLADAQSEASRAAAGPSLEAAVQKALAAVPQGEAAAGAAACNIPATALPAAVDATAAAAPAAGRVSPEQSAWLILDDEGLAEGLLNEAGWITPTRMVSLEKQLFLATELLSASGHAHELLESVSGSHAQQLLSGNCSMERQAAAAAGSRLTSAAARPTIATQKQAVEVTSQIEWPALSVEQHQQQYPSAVHSTSTAGSAAAAAVGSLDGLLVDASLAGTSRRVTRDILGRQGLRAAARELLRKHGLLDAYQQQAKQSSASGSNPRKLAQSSADGVAIASIAGIPSAANAAATGRHKLDADGQSSFRGFFRMRSFASFKRGPFAVDAAAAAAAAAAAIPEAWGQTSAEVATSKPIKGNSKKKAAPSKHVGFKPAKPYWQPGLKDLKPLREVWSPMGILVLLAYLVSMVYYMYVRIVYSLDLGQQKWYGTFVLAVELLGVTSMIPYGMMLVKYTQSTGSKGLPADNGRIVFPADKRFMVRVMVPCYKESLDTIKATVNGALDAQLPPGCMCKVYLCDDGKDDEKKAYATKLMSYGVVYVSGRTRAPNEINGKSGNLNNALCNIIYPEYEENPEDIPPQEVIVVFDADMVAKKNFFIKVLEVMWDEDVALCLTPQAFHNVDAAVDIWNHVNPQFWEYVLPGCDALGYIACTGTNVCLRARCLGQVGWFPMYCITEDYALSMELKMAGFMGKYLPEYLAVGEAPEEARAVMRQRSRWCKGHMQVFFSKRCPIIQGRLGLIHKILYTNGTWAYFATIFTSMTFTLVPFNSLVFGWHPVTFSSQFTIASTAYLVCGALLGGFVRRPSHSRGMWLSGISNHLLSFTYAKAVINTLMSKAGFKDKAGFKATAKKLAPIKAVAVKIVELSGTIGRAVSAVWQNTTGRRVSTANIPDKPALRPVHEADATVTDNADNQNNNDSSNGATIESRLPPPRRFNGEGPSMFSPRGPSVFPGSPLSNSGAAASLLTNPLSPTSISGDCISSNIGLNNSNAVSPGRTSLLGRAASGLPSGSDLNSMHPPNPSASLVLHPESSKPPDSLGSSFLGPQSSTSGSLSKLNEVLSQTSPGSSATAKMDLPPHLPAVSIMEQQGALASEHCTQAAPNYAAEEQEEDHGSSGWEWFKANWHALDGTLDPLVMLGSLAISLCAVAAGAQQAIKEGSSFSLANVQSMVQIFTSGRMDEFMLLAMLWAASNAVAPGLFFVYFVTKGRVLRWIVAIGQIFSLLCGIAAIGCLWLLIPNEVDPAAILPNTLSFLDIQRSGPGLPTNITARHPWLRPSGLTDPVPGGFYMGADYVKYNFPVATSMALLAWGVVEFKAGYQEAGVYEQALDTLAHSTLYLINCHTTPWEFVVQTGNPADYVVDLNRTSGSWGPAIDMPANRTLYTITNSSTGGSDAVAAAAAALAAASVALKFSNVALSAEALTHAKQLYRMASNLQLSSSYCASVVPCKGSAVPLQDHKSAADAAAAAATNASSGADLRIQWVGYPSSSRYDDMSWAGAWLYKATGISEYLADAEVFYRLHWEHETNLLNGTAWVPSTNEMGFAAGVMLMEALPQEPQYRALPAAMLRGWMLGKNNWTTVVHSTPKGFPWTPGAPAHNVAAASFMALMFAVRDMPNHRNNPVIKNLECFAMQQVNNLLGGLIGQGSSYIVGHGPNWPKRPYHRQASCPADGSPCSVTTALLSSLPNPHVIYGALVFGPDANNGFSDERTDTSQSSVSLWGNVMLSGLLAGLLDRQVTAGQCHGGKGFFQNTFFNYAP